MRYFDAKPKTSSLRPICHPSLQNRIRHVMGARHGNTGSRSQSKHDVMDPLSAFSLACGVIQVVDFGCKVVSRANEILQTGFFGGE